jgi:hypothetical protein
MTWFVEMEQLSENWLNVTFCEHQYLPKTLFVPPAGYLPHILNDWRPILLGSSPAGTSSRNRRPCWGSDMRRVEILPPIGGTRVAGRVARVTIVPGVMPVIDDMMETDLQDGIAAEDRQDIMDGVETDVQDNPDVVEVNVPDATQKASCNDMMVRYCASARVHASPVHAAQPCSLPTLLGGRHMPPPSHTAAQAGIEDEAESAGLNHSEAIIISYIVAQQITQSGATALLRIVRDPTFHPLDIRVGSWNQWVQRLSTLGAHGLHSVSLADSYYDGDQNVDFIFRSAWDVVREYVRPAARRSLAPTRATRARVMHGVQSGGTYA